MVERQVIESDRLENLEEEFERGHTSSGYEAGLELGQRHGQEEGYAQGLVEGGKRGSEVGYYQGYTMTWVKLLQLDISNSTKSAKVLNKLNEVLELIEGFPKTNDTFCEEKLSKIRVKFKHSTSLLNTTNTN